MVAHTVLLDFSVSSDVVLDEKKRSNLKSAIANVLQEHFNGLKPLTESNIDGSFLVLYTGPKGSLITVRGYTEGLITINIEYYKRDEEEALLDFELPLMDIKCEISVCISQTWGHYKVHFVTYKLMIHAIKIAALNMLRRNYLKSINEKRKEINSRFFIY
ncbi:uncharacterized protein LOC108626892 isoform X1 [Ceratina calcarata]|uniref:Uncharacterized protein LOC108626892 isoform X1 n=1 Tax=Ceratina calcarata TaxID=156304 RepID=A0AAJ7S432_9HYME|nr:uncharacterized protein LOC108626892 isoform X1 [Ceratina calcarata]